MGDIIPHGRYHGEISQRGCFRCMHRLMPSSRPLYHMPLYAVHHPVSCGIRIMYPLYLISYIPYIIYVSHILYILYHQSGDRRINFWYIISTAAMALPCNSHVTPMSLSFLEGFGFVSLSNHLHSAQSLRNTGACGVTICYHIWHGVIIPYMTWCDVVFHSMTA